MHIPPPATIHSRPRPIRDVAAALDPGLRRDDGREPSVNRPRCQALSGGRSHFQHGPIDCVIAAEGAPSAVAAALASAWQRFQGVLAELVSELPPLRSDVALLQDAELAVQGAVARRMVRACQPYAAQGRFITAMAAVAGSVAQELIAHFDHPRIRRAYVNNGGDIALHLGAGESYDVGLVIDPQRGSAALDGQFRVHAGSGVRGIATSGWRGRSLSLGIADSVTVLAATAAQADAAATMIANAVNVDDAAVSRLPANQVRDDSDLGDRLVTVGVASLSTAQVARALDAGAACAGREIAAGRVQAAWLCLQGQARRCAAPLAQHADILRPGPILQACAAPQALRLAPLLAASGA